MSELMDNIDGDTFCQVHKSFAINLNFIKEIRESEIYHSETDEIIPVSRTYKKLLCEAFINFKERKYLI